MNLLSADPKRYGGARLGMPRFQYWLRKEQECRFKPLKFFFKVMLYLSCFAYKCEVFGKTQIGPGLYIGHPFCITINPRAVIGKNCNIHKGVTIGQQNRGKYRGVPVIGDSVWIGVNATVVGGIHIGDDVLIAPGAYVNRDVPSHSIVLGNPCVIKQCDNATRDYIVNKV